MGESVELRKKSLQSDNYVISFSRTAVGQILYEDLLHPPLGSCKQPFIHDVCTVMAGHFG